MTSGTWCKFPDEQLYIHRLSFFLQGARVWIPHEQVIWIGGELTKDLKEDGILEIELEDGNVSLKLMYHVRRELETFVKFDNRMFICSELLRW